MDQLVPVFYLLSMSKHIHQKLLGLTQELHRNLKQSCAVKRVGNVSLDPLISAERFRG